jgi:PBSX family phage terminase large subunit
MASIEKTIRATDKQIAFLNADARYCLNYGGRGSAKSFALALKTYIRATKPGAMEGLFRFTLKALKKTTLRTLLEGDGDNPPVVPRGTYTHNKAEQIIRINGGGSIMYDGLEDPTNTGSLNLSGAAIDEVAQVSHDRFIWVNGAVRVRVPGNNLQVNMACNPGPPSHWLAKMFGLGSGNLTPAPRTWSIHTRTDDNPFLPADYVDSWRTLTGVAYRRYFLGEWCGSDGLCYDLFDRQIHVKRRELPNWKRAVIGIDEGFSHPFVATLNLVDGDGRIHIAREIYERKWQLEPKIAAVKRMALAAPCPIEAVVIPPEEPAMIEAFRTAGFTVVAVPTAYREVNQGIKILSQRMADPGDGQPRWTIDPDCEGTIGDFESYEWQTKRGTDQVEDKPKKECDDGADSARYACVYIDAQSGLLVSDSSPLLVSGSYDPEERYWS